MMNKVKNGSDMYQFATHTINFIKGQCPFACSYCYYQSNPRYSNLIGELRLDEKALKCNLGEGNTIFVGSSTDMWADEVPYDWIARVLDACSFYPHNTYLFQTKNPKRFKEFAEALGGIEKIILGTTIETNEEMLPNSKAPPISERVEEMVGLDFKTMVSIEPIMVFNLDIMISIIESIHPIFVSIGADSKNHNLVEPNSNEVNDLITELRKITEVKVKDNLKRLL